MDRMGNPKSESESHTSPDLLEVIPQALRKLRVDAGLTQIQVGKRGGPDHRTISHWENGRKLPTLRMLVQLLRALECNFYDFQDALDQLVEPPQQGRITALEDRITAVEQQLAELGGAAQSSES